MFVWLPGSSWLQKLQMLNLCSTDPKPSMRSWNPWMNLPTYQPARIDRLSRQLRASFARFCLLLSTQNMPFPAASWSFFEFLKTFCLFQHKESRSSRCRNSKQRAGLGTATGPMKHPSGPQRSRHLSDWSQEKHFLYNQSSLETWWNLYTCSFLKTSSFGFEWSVFR